MNVFLELTKNHSTFQKVTKGHFCPKKDYSHTKSVGSCLHFLSGGSGKPWNGKTMPHT